MADNCSELFIKFSQQLNAKNRPKYEIEYSVSIPNIDISNKNFGCQCPLIRNGSTKTSNGIFEEIFCILKGEIAELFTPVNFKE
jgi:hypothetical protein